MRRRSVSALKTRVKNGKGGFLYRGRIDNGAISHFYELGYCFESRKDAGIDWIIDLGANIGAEAVKFAIRHPKAKIIALEPALENFNLLAQNVSPYGDRVVALHAGVWHRDAMLELISGNSMEEFTVRESVAGGIVGRSMLSIIDQFGIDRINVLKIDIEGAEFNLFAVNSEKWLDRVDAIVMEVADHEINGSCQNFFAALERSGYIADCYICGENIVAIRRGSGIVMRIIPGTDLPVDQTKK